MGLDSRACRRTPPGVPHRRLRHLPHGVAFFSPRLPPPAPRPATPPRLPAAPHHASMPFVCHLPSLLAQPVPCLSTLPFHAFTFPCPTVLTFMPPHTPHPYTPHTPLYLLLPYLPAAADRRSTKHILFYSSSLPTLHLALSLTHTFPLPLPHTPASTYLWHTCHRTTHLHTHTHTLVLLLQVLYVRHSMTTWDKFSSRTRSSVPKQACLGDIQPAVLVGM